MLQFFRTVYILKEDFEFYIIFILFWKPRDKESEKEGEQDVWRERGTEICREGNREGGNDLSFPRRTKPLQVFKKENK